MIRNQSVNVYSTWSCLYWCKVWCVMTRNKTFSVTQLIHWFCSTIFIIFFIVLLHKYLTGTFIVTCVAFPCSLLNLVGWEKITYLFSSIDFTSSLADNKLSQFSFHLGQDINIYSLYQNERIQKSIFFYKTLHVQYFYALKPPAWFKSWFPNWLLWECMHGMNFGQWQSMASYVFCRIPL